MRFLVHWIITVVSVMCFASSPVLAEVSATEAQAIAKEAYIYANPLVDSYRILPTHCGVNG